MKKTTKTLFTLFLTLLLILSSTVTLAAKDDDGVIEMPMVPILPNTPAETSFALVTLVSDSDSSVHEGQRITFTTTISEINEDGISRAEIEYAYTGAFTYLENFYASGLPEGWSAVSSKTSYGKLLITLNKNDSVKNLTSNATLTFSFEVDPEANAEMSIGFGRVNLYDAFGEEINLFDKKVYKCSFSAYTATPAFNNIGASLRINNIPALRFGVVVTKDSVFDKYFENGDFSYSEDAEVKFGMLLIPTSKLEGELKRDNPLARVEIFESAFSENSNDVVFTMVENNVTDYKVSYTFRPFMMHKNPDGTYTYIYGDTLSRSAEGVAKAELLHATDEVVKYLLQKFID